MTTWGAVSVLIEARGRSLPRLMWPDGGAMMMRFINQSESEKSDNVLLTVSKQRKKSETKNECISCYKITVRAKIVSTFFDIAAH